MNISERHFVFYDRDERRAWLVDGASTLLHLLRASLEHYKSDIRLRRLLFADKINLVEAGATHTGSHGAFEILSNVENQSIPLYHKKTNSWTEVTASSNTIPDHSMREKTTYFCIRDRVEQLCHCLCQITAHQDDVHTQAGVGFKLRLTPRRQLEGFDFMDLATGHGTLWPKVATLNAKGQGWVDFTRAIHAPTLFGSGFGNLLVPSTAQNQTQITTRSCSNCLWNSYLPKGKDYLAASVADIKEVIRRKGNLRVQPWRIVDDIHWSAPDLSFEPCTSQLSCRSKSRNRVQVLLPSAFPKLRSRQSPSKLAVNGAVVFGHNTKLPLRWPGSRRIPEEGEPDPVDEPEELFVDSGIGTSLDSSSARRDISTGRSSGRVSPNKDASTSQADNTTLVTEGVQIPMRGLYSTGNDQFIYGESQDLKRRRHSDSGEGLVKRFRQEHEQA